MTNLEGQNTAQDESVISPITGVADLTPEVPVQPEVTPEPTPIPEPVQVAEPVQEEVPPVELEPEPVKDTQAKLQEAARVNPPKKEVPLEKYVEKKVQSAKTKQALTELAAKDSTLAAAMVMTGGLSGKEINDYRLSKDAEEAGALLHNLENAWIKNTNGALAKTANTAIQFGAGVVQGLMAIPDAVVSHHRTLSQEPQNEADLAYQTLLLAEEQRRALSIALKQDSDTRKGNPLGAPTLTEKERLEKENELKYLENQLPEFKKATEALPDYDRAKEKYVTGYYEDQAKNFWGETADYFKDAANNAETMKLYGHMSKAYDNNLDSFYTAKQHLDEGNLLQATASLFAGVSGLGVDAVEAMVTNPMGVLDLTANSMGMMAAGGAIGKGLGMGVQALTASTKAVTAAEWFGGMFMYQSMYAADAYEKFESEYGHLPDGEQMAILNGVTAVAAALALGGDKYMANSLKSIAFRPQQIQTNNLRSILTGSNASGVTGALGQAIDAVIPVGVQTAASTVGKVLGSRTAAGGLYEGLQEFSESLAVQYAGYQDLDKVDLKEATVEGLMASGSGALIGSVGDIGKGARRLAKGELATNFDSAKRGYTIQRADLSSLDAVREQFTTSINQLNQLDATLERSETGEVTASKSNIIAISDMYDTAIAEVAGLDSVFASLPSFEQLSVRAQMEEEIRKGTPLAEVLTKTANALQDWTQSSTLQNELLQSPQSVGAINALLTGLSAEQQQAVLSQGLPALIGLISGITNQAISTASTLAAKYDIDALVQGNRAYVRADKNAQKLKAKEAKAAKKEEQSAQVQAKDAAKPRAQSKFTIAEVLAPYGVTTEPEAEPVTEIEPEVTEEVIAEPEATIEEVSQADIDAELAANPAPKEDTPLNAPTRGKPKAYQAEHNAYPNKVQVTVGDSNLAAVNEAIKRSYAAVSGSPKDTKANSNYIAHVGNVIRALDALSQKAKFDEKDITEARVLSNAIATYVDAYANIAGVNPASLGQGLLKKGGPNLTKMFKALTDKGVRDIPHLYQMIANAGKDASASKAPQSNTKIDRPSAAVGQQRYSGMHSAQSLKELKVPQAFSMLNGLMGALLQGNVKDIPTEITTDIMNVLSMDAAEFDTQVTTISETNTAYQTQLKNTFKDLNLEVTTEKAAEASYLALSEYFTRVDPEHRDLTYLLSRYVPHVHSALEQKMASVELPSEFSASLSTEFTQTVHVPLPLEADLPNEPEAMVAMIRSGLVAIHRTPDALEKFKDFLIQEGAIKQGGVLFNTLTDTNFDVDVIPEMLVTKATLNRVNKFINDNQIASTSQKVGPTELTWANNAYNGINEALSRLRLSSDALKPFKVVGNLKGGMYQVFNLFSVLENPAHENYQKVTANFTQEELAELNKVLPLIQSMRNSYAHMHTNLPQFKEYMHNTRVMDLFESIGTGSTSTVDNYMHPNLSAIIAQTALEYMTTDGLMALGFNNDESLKSLVQDPYLASRRDIREHLGEGSTYSAIAPRLGGMILNRLGITTDDKIATPEDRGQLEVSLGHLALHGLETAGLIAANTVYLNQNNSTGEISVGTQAGFTQVNAPKGHTVMKTFHMYTVDPDVTARANKDEMNVFGLMGISKEVVEKLYGAKPKLGIVTDAAEINVVGGNTEQRKAAAEMSKQSPVHVLKDKLTVFENLGKELQLALFDGNHSVEGVHEARRRAVEQKNNKAAIGVARVFNTVKQLGENTSFFLHQIVGGNLRFTGVNPTGLDPIGLTGARFLTGLSATSQINIGTSTTEDVRLRDMFYRGMIQALDIGKPEEMSPQAVEDTFNELEHNSTFQRAVEMVLKARTEALNKSEVAEVSDLFKSLTGASKELGGSEFTHALDAAFVYGNYLEAKKAATGPTFTFDGNLFMEIDGKNNGSAFGLTQNAPIKDIEDFKTMARSVGLNFDSLLADGRVPSFAEVKAMNAKFLDAYQHLAKLSGEVGDKILNNQMTEEEIKAVLGDSYVELPKGVTRRELYKSTMAMLTGSPTKQLLDGDKVSKEGRSLFKQVLMTVLYTAGLPTQDNYFASVIMDNHLGKLEGFASEPDSQILRDEVKAYLTEVNKLGTKFVIPNFNKAGWQKELLSESYAIPNRMFRGLVQQVRDSIGITYRVALNTPTYQTIVHQANSVTESSNVVHLRLVYAVKRLEAKYRAAKGIAADALLTIAQRSEFEGKYIQPLITRMKHPVESVGDGVALTSTTRTRQNIPESIIADAREKYAKAENKGTFEQYLPAEYRAQWVNDAAANKNKGITYMLSQILTRVLEAPEQSGAPKSIHMMDSSTQLTTSMTGKASFLNLFDATGGNPETLATLDGTSNESFTKITGEYNTYSALADAYTVTNTAMAKVLTPEELADINKEVANTLGVPTFDYDAYMASLVPQYHSIAARAKAVHDAMLSVDQYPMSPNSPIANSVENRPTLEDVLQSHKDSFELANIFGVPSSELNSDAQKAVVLEAVKRAQGESEVIGELVQDGLNLYTPKLSFGQAVQSTLSTLVANLENYANPKMVNQKTSQNLKGLSKVLRELHQSLYTGGLLKLPTFPTTDVVEAVNQLVEASEITPEAKKMFRNVTFQAMLRGASPQEVEAGMFTGDIYVDLWMRTLPEKTQADLLNKPLKSLLHENQLDSLVGKVLATELTPLRIIRALMNSPRAKASLANLKNGKYQGMVVDHLIANLSSMKETDFNNAMLSSGLVRHPKRLNQSRLTSRLVIAGLLSLVTKDSQGIQRMFIPKRAEIINEANAQNAKGYVNALVQMVIAEDQANGVFTEELTPEVRTKQLLDFILSPEEQVMLGYTEAVVVPQSAPTEGEIIWLGDTHEITLGDTVFELEYVKSIEPVSSGEVKITFEKGKAEAALAPVRQSGEVLTSINGDVATIFQLKLSSPTFNGQPNTTYAEVNPTDLINTFDDVVQSSATQDSPAHTNHLRELVGVMSQGLKDVRIRLAEVTTEVTSGFFMNNAVHVHINRLLPRTVTNYMSGAETLAHEVVHAIGRNANEISPAIAARISELYKQAKRVITWQDLVDPTLHPDDAEIVAKEVYNHMFGSNSTSYVYTSATTGVSTTHSVSNNEAEFLAMATTNANVMRALDKHMAAKAQYKGFTNKVISTLKRLLNVFFKRTSLELDNATITQEMVALVHDLSKLQNNHISAAGKTANTISQVVKSVADSTDTKVKDFLKDVTLWSLEQPSLGKGNFTNPKSYAALAGGAVALAMGYDQYKDKFRAQMRRLKLFTSQTASDIVTELSENYGDVHKLQDLIAGRTQAIDAARNQTENAVAQFVRNLWAVPMSDAVSRALTRSVLETDLNALVQRFGIERAVEVLNPDGKRLHSLRKQYQAKLKQFKHANYYINHSKDLGEFMAKGNSSFYGGHSNAYSIARLAGDAHLAEVETESVTEIEEIVDVLASLYAVMNISPVDRTRAYEYLKQEDTYRKENQLEANTVRYTALQSVLDLHHQHTEEALESNFYSNPQLMRKGYIRESFNPNLDMVVVDTAEVDSYIKQGFEVVGDTPTGLVTDDQPKVMMVNRFAASFTYDQGAFSHTGFSSKGTQVQEDLMGMYNNIPASILTSKGAVQMEVARRSMFTADPVKVAGSNSSSIRPVRNDSGDIMAYHYTMGTATKENVLERESSLDKVVARTASSVEDKVNSQVHNLKVLQEIYKIYDEQFMSNPEEFVLIGPESKKPEHVEMYAMLPTYTRAWIDTMNQSKGIKAKGIYVPVRLLTLTFGSAPLTLEKLEEASSTKVKYITKMLTDILRSKYGRMGSAVYKELLGTAKDGLVVKNVSTTVGNIISNDFMLSAAGIPQSYIMRKTVQGTKEIMVYQKLVHAIRQHKLTLTHTPLSDSKYAVLEREIQDLESRVAKLSVTQLVDEGLYQTIVEEIDTSVGKQAYQSELSKVGDHLLSLTGNAEQHLRDKVFLTHDSMTYRYLRDAAQLSDFVARYVMFSHMTEEEGKSIEESVRESRDTFILYDQPLPSALKAANDLGFFNFSKFLLRSQGVLRKQFRKSPSRALMYSLIYMKLLGVSVTTDVFMTPFNFMELLASRMNVNPLPFLANSAGQLPLINLLK